MAPVFARRVASAALAAFVVAAVACGSSPASRHGNHPAPPASGTAAYYDVDDECPSGCPANHFCCCEGQRESDSRCYDGGCPLGWRPCFTSQR